MKTIIFFLFTMGVGNLAIAQYIPPHHYSQLVVNANDANNSIAMEYKRTGRLPSGFSTATVSELLHKNGAVALWARMSPAAKVNRQVKGGIFMQHYEEAIIDPQGRIHSFVTCSNFVPEYKFIYSDRVVKSNCYECETNVFVSVNGKLVITSNPSTDNGKTTAGTGYRASVSYN